MSVLFWHENWEDVLPELLPLMDLLWADVAVDKERFKAKCEESKYKALNDVGALCLCTVRTQEGPEPQYGKLVGFYVALILPNPHYEGQGLMVYTDQYFLLPEYRKGNIGLRFFAYCEMIWRERGAVKAYGSHKIHRDRSKMFKVLGWKATDIVYSKILCDRSNNNGHYEPGNVCWTSRSNSMKNRRPLPRDERGRVLACR